MGLLALLPLAFASEGPTLRTATQSRDFDLTSFVGVISLNGLMYTAYNQFSFMVLSRVTTATHAVLNVTRRVCVILATTLFFGWYDLVLECQKSRCEQEGELKFAWSRHTRM